LLGCDSGHCDQHLRDMAVDGYMRLLQLISDRLTLVTKSEAINFPGGIVSKMVGGGDACGFLTSSQPTTRSTENLYRVS
jgi:hypothetical protein